MMLAIFLFLVSILVLASNIHIYIKSMDDTIKAYVKIGIFYVLIPHHKIVSKLILNKNANIENIKKDFQRSKRLTLNIFSHSIIDYMYIAKFSKQRLTDNPIANGMYIILSNQLRGLLQSQFRFVDMNNIRLQYNQYYENIDYYLDAHISVINLIWASIQTIIKR